MKPFFLKSVPRQAGILAVALLTGCASAPPAPTTGAKGMDGIFYGMMSCMFMNRSGATVKAPSQIVIFPDGRCALLNIQSRTILSIPIRGGFDGSTFRGVAQKTLFFATVGAPSDVVLTFHGKDRFVVDLHTAGLPDDPSDRPIFYRQNTAEAQKIQKNWGKSVDISTQVVLPTTPYAGPATDITVDAIGGDTHAVYGVFMISDTMKTFSDTNTFLLPANRNLQPSLGPIISIPTAGLPPNAFKGAFLVVPRENPIIISNFGIGKSGNFYNPEKSRNLAVLNR